MHNIFGPILRCCPRSTFRILLCAAPFALLNFAQAAEVTVEKTEAGADIKIDGKMFTRYVIKSNTKPIVYPLMSPDEQMLNRAYPVEKVATETDKKFLDHPHHRSLWFTHGNVNGIDFWTEVPPKSDGARIGQTVHRKFVEAKSGSPASIITENDWLAPEGRRQLKDRRHLLFGVDGDQRYIDFRITLIASDGDVKFGETKEGSFGVRVANSIAVDSKQGGQIVASSGQTDAAAWGVSCPWVDYHGPVGGKTEGIAILNHPSSFRYPTYWHVRTYGLFAANVFGRNEFTKGKQPKSDFVLPEGKTIEFAYRVILHAGDEKQAKIAEAFAKYEKEKLPD